MSQKPTRAVPQVVDTVAHPTALECYVLRPVLGTANINGFFLNTDGEARWLCPSQAWDPDFDHSLIELFVGNSGHTGVTPNPILSDGTVAVSGAVITMGIGLAALGYHDGELKNFHVWAENGTAQGQVRRIIDNKYSTGQITLASAFSPQLTGGDNVNIGRLDPGAVGFIGHTDTDLRINYSRDYYSGEARSSPDSDEDGLTISAGWVAFGRVPPNFELFGVGGSASSSGAQTTLVTPPRIVVVQDSADDAVLQVECWDGDHLPLLFDSSDPSVEVTLTGGLASALFYYLSVHGIEVGALVPGMPDGTKGCRMRVSPSSIGGVVVNFAGTTDGSGTRGLNASSTGPTANGPMQLSPGDSITVGLK